MSCWSANRHSVATDRTLRGPHCHYRFTETEVCVRQLNCRHIHVFDRRQNMRNEGTMQDLSHNERIHTGQSTGLFVSLLLLINTSVVAEPPETRLDNDAVIQALRARNDRYRTGRFSWTEERFDAKGSYLHPDMNPSVLRTIILT